MPLPPGGLTWRSARTLPDDAPHATVGGDAVAVPPRVFSRRPWRSVQGAPAARSARVRRRTYPHGRPHRPQRLPPPALAHGWRRRVAPLRAPGGSWRQRSAGWRRWGTARRVGSVRADRRRADAPPPQTRGAPATAYAARRTSKGNETALFSGRSVPPRLRSTRKPTEIRWAFVFPGLWCPPGCPGFNSNAAPGSAGDRVPLLRRRHRR